MFDGAERRHEQPSLRRKLAPLPHARLARLQPPDVQSLLLGLDMRAEQLHVIRARVLPHEPLADEAEDEPSRVVRLAVEAGQPAEVDVLRSVTFGRTDEAGFVRGAGHVNEVVLEELNRGVDSRQVFEQSLEGPRRQRVPTVLSCGSRETCVSPARGP